MTVAELITNLNAYGVGVGSGVEDALDGAQKYDPRLCALVNRGIADLNKIRPRRGVVELDLVALMNENTGAVELYDAFAHFSQRVSINRLDAYSFASEDTSLYGIVPTGSHTFRVSPQAKDYINGKKAENATIAEENARIEEENAEIEDEEQRKPLLSLVTLPITVTFLLTPMQITVNELPETAANATEIDLDEDLADLLPSFVASFLYLEENPGTAQYYRSMYETRRQEIVAREYNHLGASRSVTTNGW